MVDDGSVRSRQRGLQHAASVIFALVAVVPLLIFAWTLHALQALGQLQAQIGLGLALAIALLGFWMFRSLLGRMAEVVQALAAAVEQASRIRRAPASAPATVTHDAERSPVVAGATAAADATPHTVAARADGAGHDRRVEPAVAAPAAAPPAPRPAASRATTPAPAVAGLGKIRELTEVVRTMDALWYREATAHVGLRVQVSVANSREPLVGTLSEATPDGLILEQPDGALPIAYGRVTAIDRLTTHA
jgi:hypothetical protein